MMRIITVILFLLIAAPAFSQIGMTLRRDRDTTGGGGGITDPTDIADLELWLDGADVDGDATQEGTGEGTLTGTQVDDWIDKSGNGRNFSRSGSPQLQLKSGTLYSVAVDGNDHFVSDDAASTWTFLHSGDISVFVVMEVDNINSGTTQLILSTSGSSSSTVGHYFAWSDAGGGFNLDKDIFVFNANGTSSRNIYHFPRTGSVWGANNEFHSVTMTTDVDAASWPSTARINDSRLNGSSVSVTVSSVATGSASLSAPFSTLNLFRYSGGGSNLSGSVAEIVIYDRILTASEISDVETYLTNKWGL